METVLLNSKIESVLYVVTPMQTSIPLKSGMINTLSVMSKNVTQINLQSKVTDE